jgi:hypothetical protein
MAEQSQAQNLAWPLGFDRAGPGSQAVRKSPPGPKTHNGRSSSGEAWGDLAGAIGETPLSSGLVEGLGSVIGVASRSISVWINYTPTETKLQVGL